MLQTQNFYKWEVFIIIIIIIIIIITIGSTGVWTQGLHLEPLHHWFFVMGFLR
jgi:hypothetical protein